MLSTTAALPVARGDRPPTVLVHGAANSALALAGAVPAVLDAAVIPKRDYEAGEIPKGFVVLKEGQQADADELMRFVAERVAPYKKLREIEFVASIPKTASGKILRRELIEQERAKSKG